MPSTSADARRPALVFVGAVVPDTDEFRTAAFSRAGNMFVTNMLSALSAAGVRPDQLLGYLPAPAFPADRRLWVGARRAAVAGLPARMCGYPNVALLKQVWIGAAILFRLLQWGCVSARGGSRIIYTFNLTTPPGVFVWMAARLTGSVAVVSVNDINEPGQTVSGGWVRRLEYALQRWSLRRFDSLVVVSERIVEDHAAGREHLLLEGGVDARLLALPAVERNPDAPFTIVMAGGLEPVNGFEVALRAMERLPGRNVRLRIAGAGELEDLVRVAAASDPRVEYLGFLSFPEVVRLYGEADVLLNMRLTHAISSRYFFPSKLIEYLASGTPVITTCTGHTEREFGEFAFLLRDETPEGLAAMIDEVMRVSREERVRMGQAARAYMLKEKTWEAQGRRLAAFLLSEVERVAARV